MTKELHSNGRQNYVVSESRKGILQDHHQEKEKEKKINYKTFYYGIAVMSKR
jgi:hypothetical protein